VALCFLGWALLLAGRTILSPVLGTIGEEWGLDETRLGLVSSLFFFAYVAMQIPTGILADRIGRKALLVAGLGVFALATVLRGAAPGYAVFLAAGVLAGMGQGTYYTTQYAISSAALPASQRGLGSAVINSGMAVGSSLGMIVASVLVFQLGWSWRVPFLLTALPVVGLAILFGLFVKEKRPQDAGHGRRRLAAPRRLLPGVLNARLLSVCFVGFTSVYGFYLILTWLPYYLQYERGFAGSVTGLVSSLVPWAAIPGALLFSRWSDRAGSRMRFIRLLLPVGAVSMVGIVETQSLAGLYGVLVLYGLMGKLAVDPLMVAEVVENSPPESISTALGFLNFAGMAAAVAAPYVTGYLGAVYGDMKPAFYVAAGLLVAGLAASFAVPATRAGDAVSRQCLRDPAVTDR